MAEFLLGLFAGSMFGMFIACVLVASSEGNKK
jgi:hypothetical protein